MVWTPDPRKGPGKWQVFMFLKTNEQSFPLLNLHTLPLLATFSQLINILKYTHLKNSQTYDSLNLLVGNLSLFHAFKHLSSPKSPDLYLGPRPVYQAPLKHWRWSKILSPPPIPSYCALYLTKRCSCKLSPTLAALTFLTGHQAPPILSGSPKSSPTFYNLSGTLRLQFTLHPINCLPHGGPSEPLNRNSISLFFSVSHSLQDKHPNFWQDKQGSFLLGPTRFPVSNLISFQTLSSSPVP